MEHAAQRLATGVRRHGILPFLKVKELDLIFMLAPLMTESCGPRVTVICVICGCTSQDRSFHMLLLLDLDPDLISLPLPLPCK
jgi:hypothetical protein